MRIQRHTSALRRCARSCAGWLWQEGSLVDRDALRHLAEALPKGSALPVPREWLLELLGPAPDGPPPGQPAVDLTAGEVAGLLSRKEVTVRGWCAAGLLPGAYRLLGREWRIPRASLADLPQATARRAS